jgi:DNA-binding CsgD family transcriptional regulator
MPAASRRSVTRSRLRARAIDAAGGGPLLLERRAEIAAIGGLLDQAVSGDGALALVEGPAGIGKTRLLDACAEEADGRGMRVLRACGDEVGMELPFAGVRELFWEARPGVHDGAAALAAPVFDGSGGELDPDRVSAVLHGLYWLVANLAEQAPLALLVDDVHWLDRASARFLAYFSRRLESLPVLLVGALRDGEDPGGAGAPLPRLAARVLRPAPLSEAAASQLIRAELGPRADGELCRSCYEATGGNPFYVQALTAALLEEGGRPTVELARRVRALGAGAVRRSVLLRLARMGGDCGLLARAAAVLAPGSPLRHGAALAGLEREAAQGAADRLRAGGLLEPAQELSFSHPIVREAVAAELAPSQRAALNLRAAKLLCEESAPADRIAAHLLAAEAFGERWVVDALRVAAHDALARGAPEVAAGYLRRALCEPPEPELRLALLRELGRAEQELPFGQQFPALREALRLAQDPRTHAAIALDLAWALAATGRASEIVPLLEPELDGGGGIDDEVRQGMEALLLGTGGTLLEASRRLWGRASGQRERARRGELRDPVVMAALALIGAVAGLTASEAARYARLALRDERLVRFPAAYGGAACALSWTDDLREAACALDVAMADAQRRGSVPMFMNASLFRGATALRAGDLDLAEDHGQRAYEIGCELGAGGWAMMFFLPLLLERGRAEDALSVIEPLAFEEPWLMSWEGAIVLAQRGRARVALGDLSDGVADMLDADGRMADGGCDLSVPVDWIASAVPALVQLGRTREARTLAERELAAANLYGAPRRQGIALSTCGLLDAGRNGLALLRHAVKLLECSPARLEYARALVNLGASLRQRGEHEQARAPLARGLDIAHTCGAVALVNSARAELMSAGARPRRAALSGAGALTPAELRTARMAAEGLSNREIAQALFVSMKTVETHLSHVYGKLGISGRGELGGALAARRQPPRGSAEGTARRIRARAG